MASCSAIYTALLAMIVVLGAQTESIQGLGRNSILQHRVLFKICRPRTFILILCTLMALMMMMMMMMKHLAHLMWWSKSGQAETDILNTYWHIEQIFLGANFLLGNPVMSLTNLYKHRHYKHGIYQRVMISILIFLLHVDCRWSEVDSWGMY